MNVMDFWINAQYWFDVADVDDTSIGEYQSWYDVDDDGYEIVACGTGEYPMAWGWVLAGPSPRTSHWDDVRYAHFNAP